MVPRARTVSLQKGGSPVKRGVAFLCALDPGDSSGLLGRCRDHALRCSLLALEPKPLIAERTKKQQGTRTDISQKSVKSHDTQKELAKIAGVSHDTIHKVEAIEEKATDRTKQLVPDGRLSFFQSYLFKLFRISFSPVFPFPSGCSRAMIQAKSTG